MLTCALHSGYIQTFGVFQTYYTATLREPVSTISWIGSIQIFLLFILGPLAGRATDAGYFRPVFISGLVLQLLGVFMTSISSKYWQIFLAQGVCQGLGNGLQFVPTMSLLSTYFAKNRAFAIGIAATGATTGGMVMPAMVQQLLPKIGFGWTVRALGLVMLVLGATAAYFLKTRIPPRKAGPLVEWSAFTEPPFVLFCIGMCKFLRGSNSLHPDIFNLPPMLQYLSKCQKLAFRCRSWTSSARL
jgi:MFS family permease